MINEAETFVYRNRLASLIKIDPELFPPFRQLSPPSAGRSHKQLAPKSSLREQQALALRSIHFDAYIVLEQMHPNPKVFHR